MFSWVGKRILLIFVARKDSGCGLIETHGGYYGRVYSLGGGLRWEFDGLIACV